MTRYSALFATMLLFVSVGNIEGARIQRHSDKADTQMDGFCNYPQWTIPGVGSEGRCDHNTPCPKRLAHDEQLYGTLGGDTQNVTCAGDPDGTAHGMEIWKCTGNDAWTLVSQPISCHKAKHAGFCNYPQWTIPGVGTEGRCDHSTPCPKRLAHDDWLYGTVGGDTQNVTCAGDLDGTSQGMEVWKCTGDDEWTLVSSPISCHQRKQRKQKRTVGFCNYPQWNIPGVGTKDRCDHTTKCTKRLAHDDWLYGTLGGDTQNVACANDVSGAAYGMEEWKCTGDDEWTLVSEEISCDSPGRPSRGQGEDTGSEAAPSKCENLSAFMCKITSGCRCDGAWDSIWEYVGCGTEGCQAA